jgi:hypothetical protein
MEEITLGKYIVKVLDPKILVFTNVLKNPDGLVDYYEKLNNWESWYAFGYQSGEEAPEDGTRLVTEKFPTVEDWAPTLNKVPQNPYRDEIHYSFLDISKLYMEHTNTSLPEWEYFSGWRVAKYVEDVDHAQNSKLSMTHHTDYEQNREGQPGHKFGVTAVYYPNDGYEGGEISFRVTDPGTFNIKKEILYKPTKGDVVIFPSTDPYYHGVRRIWKKPKYIIRLYWQWEDKTGSVEWNSLRKKYGNEKFEALEAQRLKRHDLMCSDPIQKPLLTATQYYDLLDRGLLPDKDHNEKRVKLFENLVSGMPYDNL